MNYILNSLEEIRKVYTPDIECLNTPLDWIPFTFCGIENTIFESMRFCQYYYYGDDYEKEDLSIKDFNFKNKSHKYSGFNYDYLLKNIDLEFFKVELEKSVTTEENHFIFKINEELSKAGGNIEFIKRLRKNVDSLVSSSKFLKSILEKANEFDKILINRFIVSYRYAYDSLKDEHEQDIVPVIIFKSDHFKPKDDLKETVITKEVNNKNKQLEWVSIHSNPYYSQLAKDLHYGNDNNIIVNATTIKTEISNPFTKDELKLILDNNLKDDFINKFYEKETDLFKQGYFKEGKWDKSKKSLIVFCKVIAESSYIQKRHSGKKLLPIFKFFEKRYNVKLGDQRKPCNHKVIVIDENDFADFK